MPIRFRNVICTAGLLVCLLGISAPPLSAATPGCPDLSALQPTPASVHLLHVAAALWIIAFALYLWRFFPWMIRPRADAVAKPAAPMMKIVPAGPRRAP